MQKHYVEFSYVGKRNEVCEHRSGTRVNMPEGAIAYRLFDRTELIYNGENLMGKKRNVSPLTYIGEEYTLGQIRESFPECRALISNMEIGEKTRAVRTKDGVWRMLESDDKVVQG
ncbi:MAG: hypothetical protein IKV94_03875 [Clostridia bacterium]|nr:hypothetical protein [Clostridia bacterium]